MMKPAMFTTVAIVLVGFIPIAAVFGFYAGRNEQWQYFSYAIAALIVVVLSMKKKGT